jgi:hypothetical protein
VGETPGHFADFDLKGKDTMISPHSTDAESYETTLALLGRVAPIMPAAARSRAAWNVASAKLDLKAAVAAEGFSLHTAPLAPPPKAASSSARVTAPPAPPTPAQLATLAALAGNIARTKAEIAALKAERAGATAAGGASAAPAVFVPHPADHIGHAPGAYSPENAATHKAAIAYMTNANERGLRPSYAEAIRNVTRKRTA